MQQQNAAAAAPGPPVPVVGLDQPAAVTAPSLSDDSAAVAVASAADALAEVEALKSAANAAFKAGDVAAACPEYARGGRLLDELEARINRGE